MMPELPAQVSLVLQHTMPELPAQVSFPVPLPDARTPTRPNSPPRYNFRFPYLTPVLQKHTLNSLKPKENLPLKKLVCFVLKCLLLPDLNDLVDEELTKAGKEPWRWGSRPEELYSAIEFFGGYDNLALRFLRQAGGKLPKARVMLLDAFRYRLEELPQILQRGRNLAPALFELGYFPFLGIAMNDNGRSAAEIQALVRNREIIPEGFEGLTLDPLPGSPTLPGSRRRPVHPAAESSSSLRGGAAGALAGPDQKITRERSSSDCGGNGSDWDRERELALLGVGPAQRSVESSFDDHDDRFGRREGEEDLRTIGGTGTSETIQEESLNFVDHGSTSSSVAGGKKNGAEGAGKGAAFKMRLFGGGTGASSPKTKKRSSFLNCFGAISTSQQQSGAIKDREDSEIDAPISVMPATPHGVLGTPPPPETGPGRDIYLADNEGLPTPIIPGLPVDKEPGDPLALGLTDDEKVSLYTARSTLTEDRNFAKGFHPSFLSLASGFAASPTDGSARVDQAACSKENSCSVSSTTQVSTTNGVTTISGEDVVALVRRGRPTSPSSSNEDEDGSGAGSTPHQNPRGAPENAGSPQPEQQSAQRGGPAPQRGQQSAQRAGGPTTGLTPADNSSSAGRVLSQKSSSKETPRDSDALDRLVQRKGLERTFPGSMNDCVVLSKLGMPVDFWKCCELDFAAMFEHFRYEDIERSYVEFLEAKERVLRAVGARTCFTIGDIESCSFQFAIFQVRHFPKFVR